MDVMTDDTAKLATGSVCPTRKFARSGNKLRICRDLSGITAD